MFTMMTPVYANVAPKSWPGAGGSEMTTLYDCPIKITNEQLQIDIKPDDNERTLCGDIVANYSVFNPSTEHMSIKTYFPIICNSHLSNQRKHSVTLDGVPLELLEYTFDIANENLMNYYHLDSILNESPSQGWPYWGTSYSVMILEFQLDLPPQKAVTLEIQSTMHAFMEVDRVFKYIPYRTRYTFQYFFTPAQRWASFDNITIDIYLGKGAYTMSNSNLPFVCPEKGRYTYKTDHLPKDDLLFTITTNTLNRWILTIAISVVGILIIVFIVRIVCMTCSRRFAEWSRE